MLGWSTLLRGRGRGKLGRKLVKRVEVLLILFPPCSLRETRDVRVRTWLKRTDDAGNVETLLAENARVWLGDLEAEEVILLLGS